MSTSGEGGSAADAAGSGRKSRVRGSVGAAVARAVREAPRGARPLLVARRRVAQHLADALDGAMAEGSTLLVIKLNAQLELAISRAELDGAGEVIFHGDGDQGGRGLDDELAELAAGEPTLGDSA